jgi:hypothetical protein
LGLSCEKGKMNKSVRWGVRKERRCGQQHKKGWRERCFDVEKVAVSQKMLKKAKGKTWWATSQQLTFVTQHSPSDKRRAKIFVTSPQLFPNQIKSLF